jgi:hypothetical protein
MEREAYVSSDEALYIVDSHMSKTFVGPHAARLFSMCTITGMDFFYTPVSDMPSKSKLLLFHPVFFLQSFSAPSDYVVPVKSIEFRTADNPNFSLPFLKFYGWLYYSARRYNHLFSIY